MSTPTTFTIRVEDLSKSFGKRLICDGISLELPAGASLGVVGPNGSGKTTFLRMLAGLLRPDRGRVLYEADGRSLKRDQWYRHVALVSPDLALYDELTGIENLEFASQVLGGSNERSRVGELLEKFGLSGRGDDYVRSYSAGMKHRLKFAAALLKRPSVLLLDEPTALLDEDGTARVWRSIERRSLVLVIATNDPRDAARAQHQLRMGQSSTDTSQYA